MMLIIVRDSISICTGICNKVRVLWAFLSLLLLSSGTEVALEPILFLIPSYGKKIN